MSKPEKQREYLKLNDEQERMRKRYQRGLILMGVLPDKAERDSWSWIEGMIGQ